MILEGLVTTIDGKGELNIAPMGPRMGQDFQRFELKPFKSSTTFRNLKACGEGVMHVTDDVLLIARSAIGAVKDARVEASRKVKGYVLIDSCRYFEFRVVEIDETAERARFVVETVHQQTLRDFFGFNRAKHAVLEAAILATRASFLPLDDVAREFVKIQEIVSKTGGVAEHEALRLLRSQVVEQARQRDIVLDMFEV